MYHKWQWYDVWSLRFEALMDTSFCHFGPFTPLTTQKIKILKSFKKSKKHGDIIILHKPPKNHDHMLYFSLDIMHNRCNCYFSFWAIFFPFIPLTAQKIDILKKWKKSLEISSIYTSVPKIMIICYIATKIWRVTDVIVTFHFGLLFALLPPLAAQKINVLKK